MLTWTKHSWIKKRKKTKEKRKKKRKKDDWTVSQKNKKMAIH